ncbi:hypothetical protein [Vibrio vulnificus]|uniref:hypothetical protein n=1 Tax=Vibrio vulnificus TaxID=672 RepID=UPI0005F0D5C9|nr:hypothetical protein [Vibrio vulnificus]
MWRIGWSLLHTVPLSPFSKADWLPVVALYENGSPCFILAVPIKNGRRKGRHLTLIVTVLRALAHGIIIPFIFHSGKFLESFCWQALKVVFQKTRKLDDFRKKLKSGKQFFQTLEG